MEARKLGRWENDGSAPVWTADLGHSMVRPGRDMLTGGIEVDECYLGGLSHFVDGKPKITLIAFG